MSQQTHHNPSPDSLTRGYEPGDMHPRWFVWPVVFFIAFAAVSHIALWYLIKADANPRDVDRPASAVDDYRPNTNAPPLQPTPHHDFAASKDLESMRRGEDQVFAALGWQVDPATHSVTPPDALVRRVTTRFATTHGAAR